MKNKIITFILILTCIAVTLSGCGLGSYVESGNKSGQNTQKPTDPENPDNPVNPVNPNDYTLNVYYNNEPFRPGDTDVTCIWRGVNGIERVVLDANGYANAGELDGDYYVYLEGLPENYSYKPGQCVATADERNVTIVLTDIMQPVSGDGHGLYRGQGCYYVRYDGTYRAQLNGESDYRYYEYCPTAAGVYSIVSWVNVFDDKLDPQIDIYNGSLAYKWYSKTLKTGGFSLDGGYTRNFRYECRIDATEVGSSFSFCITAKDKFGEYPAYVDFAITYEGEYSSENSDVRIQRAQSRLFKAPEPAADETFVFSDFGTKRFDANNFRYNEDDGRYHYFNLEEYPENKGWGPVLYCAIKKSIPSFTTTTLYNADSVGENGISFNWLRLYNVWIEAEQKFAVFDYTDFIKKDYNGVCNSDGVCYVTKELITFLAKFAENHSLYTDGVNPLDGTPEALGYTANQDSLWMFACGVYLKK